MDKPCIGTTVQYFADKTTVEPQAGIVVQIHDDADDCVCLVSWCRQTLAWHEHHNVPMDCGESKDGSFWRLPQPA